MTQAIRLFVSSTFRDMHAERDQLSHIVFPELRSRCLKRGADFLGVDLRWGVTEEEAEQEGALALCLKEIERCRPFFVCLLGDRFGWVPPPEEVPARLFEDVNGTGALPLAIAECYHLDETVVPAAYRLRRDRKLPSEVAEELARFWEAKGLLLAGDSITAREILRGAFEDGYPATHAFIYLRKAGLERHPAFPRSFLSVFVEQDPDRRRRLAVLKKRIRAAAGWVSVRVYKAFYAGLRIDPALLPWGLSAGERETLQDGVIAPDEWSRLSEPVRGAIEAHGTVALDGMDALGQRILDDLWPAIEAELGRPAEILDVHQRERTHHERFVIDRMRLFIGRASETQRVAAYVANPEDRWPLVVTGPPGVGKSAFLAGCVGLCRELHPATLVLPYFIGAAPGSAALPATLGSLCETLRREMALAEEIEADPLKLRVQLGRFLEKAGARRPVVVFLDALNQLDPAGRGHELDWIPYVLPAGTRLVVSTVAGDCLEQLRRRVPDDHVVDIPALPVDDRRALVEQFLEVRRKKLTAEQLARILDTERRPEAGLPLYLLVALEELCLFGDHQALSQRIDRLPGRLPELFDQVLARLEQDHTRATAESVCAWLAVSRSGLRESEILDLLGGSGTFPRVRWTRLYRGLEPYLKPVEEAVAPGEDAAGLLDFYHDQLRLAACRRYLGMAAPDEEATEACRAAHRQLADYFRSVARDETLPDPWRTDRVRGLSELPYHQTRGEMWDELGQTLCDFHFIEVKCSAGLTFGLVSDYALAGLAVAGPPIQRAFFKDEVGQARCFSCLRYVSIAPAHLGQTLGCPVCGSVFRVTPFCIRVKDFPGNSIGPARPVEERRRGSMAAAGADFSRFVASNAHLLHQYPHLTFQQAILEPTGTAPAKMAADALRKRPRSKPWLQPADHKEETAEQRLTTLLGHTQAVSKCEWSSCGTKVMSASWDNTLRLWSAQTGEEFARLSGHGMAVPTKSPRIGAESLALRESIASRLGQSEGRIVDAAFSTDGQLVVSAGWDGLLKLWPAGGSAEVATLYGHSGRMAACGFSSDGRTVLSASFDATLRLWDVFSGKEKAILSGHTKAVVSCAWNPHRPLILSASWDNTLRLWHSETGREIRILTGHRDRVTMCAFSPNGEYIASASQDGTVRIWDVDTGSLLRVLVEHNSGIRSCFWSPEGEAVLVSGPEDSELVCATSGQRRASFQGSAPVNAAPFSPDARYLAIASGRVLCIHETSRGESRSSLHGHSSPVTAWAWSPDGMRLASGCNDGSLILWNAGARTGDETTNASTGTRRRILAAVAADRQSLLVRHDAEDQLVLCESAAGTVRGILVGHADAITTALFTPDSRFVVTASRDSTLKRWDVRNGDALSTFLGHSDAVVTADISPDGSRLISGSFDRTAKLWNVLTQDELSTFLTSSRIVTRQPGISWREDQDFGPVMATSFSPDGSQVLLARLRANHESRPEMVEIVIVNLQTGQERVRFWAHQKFTGQLAWSPDGRVFATVGYKRVSDIDHSNRGYRAINEISVWNAFTGERLQVLPVPGELSSLTMSTHGCSSLAYSPDARSLLVIGPAASLARWDALTGLQRSPLDGILGPVSFANYSPDGSVICTYGSYGTDSFLQLWNDQTSAEMAKAVIRGYPTCLAVDWLERRVLLAHAGEEIQVVYLRDLQLEVPVVTAVRLYEHDSEEFACDFTFQCPWCSRRAAVPARLCARIGDLAVNRPMPRDLGTAIREEAVLRFLIKTLEPPTENSKAREEIAEDLRHDLLGAEGFVSPPDEIHHDPRLSSRCPACGRTVRLNPFSVDARP